jgi:atypical dual specificity phosphatase
VSDWFVKFGLAAVDPDRRLFIGAIPTDHGDVDALSERGVEVVVNLCEDSEYPAGARIDVEAALARAGIGERRLPFTDHGSLGLPQLDAAIGEVMQQLDTGRRVYLHCRAGRQRSTAVATGALAVREGVSLKDALTVIQERKPDALPLEHQWLDLEDWYRQRAAA